MNYQQLPVNAPIVPVANFQRDGLMAFNNQGLRPNYQSTIVPLTYKPKPYSGTDLKHETWIGNARYHLSKITELDFEQPRVLFQRVMDDKQREATINNFSGHLKQVKKKEIVLRQRA